MKILWHCEKCGSIGSSETRTPADRASEGRLARLLHDAVSPDCKPEASDIRVTVAPEDRP